MRYKGTLVQWNDARGFGYIESAEGGKRIFCHVRAFRDRAAKPAEGLRLTYAVGRDAQGRDRAQDVWLSMSLRGREPIKAGAPPHAGRAVIVSTVFFALLLVLALFERLTWVALPWYLGLSAITFITYTFDKRAALRNVSRTPERILQMLAVAGGWPGAWIAQQALRHKTVKRSFQIEFWICVFVNVGVLAALVWSGGQLPGAA